MKIYFKLCFTKSLFYIKHANNDRTKKCVSLHVMLNEHWAGLCAKDSYSKSCTELLCLVNPSDSLPNHSNDFVF